MKFCLLVALVVSAALFDVYHHVNLGLGKNSDKTPFKTESETNKVFFCTQAPGFNLKTLGTQNPIRTRFDFNQDKFLIKYYNLRTFQLMKAETSPVSFSSVRYFHSLPYRRVLYSSPDDTPPLA